MDAELAQGRKDSLPRRLDQIRRLLRDPVQRARQVRADLERHHRRVDDTQVLCAVHDQRLGVHDACGGGRGRGVSGVIGGSENGKDVPPIDSGSIAAVPMGWYSVASIDLTYL